MTRTDMDVVRILLVDDHTLFRESLHRLLSAEEGFEVIGDYASAEDTLRALKTGLTFDVALVDYDLSASGPRKANGLEFLRMLREEHPAARLLMVTAGMTDADSRRAILDMRAGLFLKTEPIAELLVAVERTARGEQWVSSAAAVSFLSESRTVRLPAAPMAELSAREQDVLRGVLEGFSNKEIGHRLDLSESSVKAVLQRLFERTGVRSRSQLVRIAIEAQFALE